MSRSRSNGAEAIHAEGAVTTEGVSSAIATWRDQLIARTKRRPAQTLLAAVGVGYVAGGGIATLLTARLLAMAAHLAVRLAIVPIVADGIERALFDRSTDTSAAGHAPDAKQLTHHSQKETTP